jgi:hypothetical protein
MKTNVTTNLVSTTNRNSMKITAVKTALFLLCFFCAAAAFGQAAGVISSQAVMLQLPDHPQHASQHEMASEQSLLSGSTYSYAQGERPLWEFGSALKQPAPLGDIARAVRKEHAAAKKAQRILEK